MVNPITSGHLAGAPDARTVSNPLLSSTIIPTYPMESANLAISVGSIRVPQLGYWRAICLSSIMLRLLSQKTITVIAGPSDGTVHKGHADYPRGSPRDPMSFEDVAEIFTGCAVAAGWPADKSERTIEMVAGLEELDTIRDLTAKLTS